MEQLEQQVRKEILEQLEQQVRKEILEQLEQQVRKEILEQLEQQVRKEIKEILEHHAHIKVNYENFLCSQVPIHQEILSYLECLPEQGIQQWFVFHKRNNQTTTFF